MYQSLSLSAYIEEWMTTFKAYTVKQSTYDRLMVSAKALQPYSIASMPIGEITSIHIQKYVNELAESGYGLSTIKKQMRIVTAPLKQASALHLIPANPAVGIKLPVRCSIQNGDNIFDPSTMTNAGFYYDFADGKTEISEVGVLITKDFINVGLISALYVRHNYVGSGNPMFLVYCYNDNDEYLGYVQHRPMSESGSVKYTLFTGTTRIKIYVNNSSFTSNLWCVSKNPLDEFKPYETHLEIKNTILPKFEEFYPLKGKVIVNFGDSVFGNKRPPTDISTKLAEITGATVYNLGFGGCRMSQHSANWDAFSMYRLADAIADNDFSMQDAVDISSTGLPSYFIKTRTLLESIDFNDVDIVTIAYGTNDFTASVNLDSDSNIYDTTTFAGALRYSIEKLLGKYPHLKIFVCGQTYRFWMDSEGVFIDDSDTRTNSNGAKLTDFVTKTKDVSKDYHLKFIDNYYELGINKFNISHWFPSGDGTHHNELGGKLIAEHMANEMF